MRPELEQTVVPARIRRLAVDVRGYPVPWFVPWVDGTPEFRAMDPDKWTTAIVESRCWVCGDMLGRHRVFVIGPMCAVNRTTAEPPCHADCAEWSAKHCPFLSRPKMVRRQDDVINNERMIAESPGIAIVRNPGVALLWWSRHYATFRDGKGGALIDIGDPERVAWYAEGREATRVEVEESIRTGLPFLREQCDGERLPWRRREAHAEITRRVLAIRELLPAA